MKILGQRELRTVAYRKKETNSFVSLKWSDIFINVVLATSENILEPNCIAFSHSFQVLGKIASSENAGLPKNIS